MTLFRQRWVSLLALLGVMLHAAALTGHHTRSMSMAIAQAAATPGSIVICRADGGTETITIEQMLKGGSGKSSKSTTCPLCCGAAPAFAVTAPAPVLLAVIARTVDAPLIVEHAALPVARAVRPPATGPPALV
ncbi:MAG: DUF2946 family protein [Hyphomicrobium sp.]